MDARVLYQQRSSSGHSTLLAFLWLVTPCWLVARNVHNALVALCALAALSAVLIPPPASAWDAEAGSTGNRIYSILWQANPLDPFVDLEIEIDAPPFVLNATAIFVPPTIPPLQPALVGIEFDVDADVQLWAEGDAVMRVIGLNGPCPIEFEVTLPIVIVPDAPGLQGDFDGGEPIPGLELLDTDGDTVSDLVEITAGSDPFDPLSVPGPFPVPTLGPIGLLLSVLLLLIAGHSLGRPGRMRVGR